MFKNTLIVYITLIGLLIGSAINAIVWRLYVGRKWTHGRSMCPDCKHVLGAKDLVPVVSWIMLGGRCRYCKAKIHWQYPVVELLTAGLFGLSAVAISPSNFASFALLAIWFVILSALIILAVYDARWLILPDKVMVPLVGLSLTYVALAAISTHSTGVALGAFAAAAVAGGTFYALAIITRGKAMGGGDIKLAFAMGLLLGVQGTAVAMLLAFNSAALVGIALIVTKKKGRKDQIPFGPYLVAGTIVAFLFGRQIVEWYLRLNGLA